MSYKSSDGEKVSVGAEEEVAGSVGTCSEISMSGSVGSEVCEDGAESVGADESALVLCPVASAEVADGPVLCDGTPPEKAVNREESNSGDNPPNREKRSGPEASEVFALPKPPVPLRPEKRPDILPKREEGSVPEFPMPENSPGRMSL